MKTNNAIDAGNYIINALYDGLSAKASGTDIVSAEGPFKKMKSVEKDKVAAAYVYLLAHGQHEGNPLYNASTPLEAMNPKFVDLLKKNWTESDLMADDVDVAQQKAQLATLSNVYHAVRKALDVKNLTGTPTDIPTNDELTVHAAIEAILSQIPPATPFANQGDLDEHHAVVAPMLGNSYKCSEPAELEHLTNYWQKLKASESTIKNGGLKLPNWPQMPATTAERADLMKGELARVKGSIHRQTVNVIQASQNAQATEIGRNEPEAVEAATPEPGFEAVTEPSTLTRAATMRADEADGEVDDVQEEALNEQLQNAISRPASAQSNASESVENVLDELEEELNAVNEAETAAPARPQTSSAPTHEEFLTELKEALSERSERAAKNAAAEEAKATEATEEPVATESAEPQLAAPELNADETDRTESAESEANESKLSSRSSSLNEIRVSPSADDEDEPKLDLSDPSVTVASIARTVHKTAAQTPLTFVVPQGRRKPVMPFDGPHPLTFVMPQQARPSKPASHFTTQVLHSRPTIIDRHGDK